MKKTFLILTFILFLSGCLSLTGSRDSTYQQATAIRDECQAQWQDTRFDPIRDKIELFATSESGKYTFNNSYPTISEQQLIKEMAVMLDSCESRIGSLVYVSSPSIGARSIAQANAVSEQLLNLYNRKITWGEFTKRRYQILNIRAQYEAQENQRRQEQWEAQRQRERELDRQARERSQQRRQEASEKAMERMSRDRIKHTTCTPTVDGGMSCTTY